MSQNTIHIIITDRFFKVFSPASVYDRNRSIQRFFTVVILFDLYGVKLKFYQNWSRDRQKSIHLWDYEGLCAGMEFSPTCCWSPPSFPVGRRLSPSTHEATRTSANFPPSYSNLHLKLVTEIGYNIFTTWSKFWKLLKLWKYESTDYGNTNFTWTVTNFYEMSIIVTTIYIRFENDNQKKLMSIFSRK